MQAPYQVLPNTMPVVEVEVVIVLNELEMVLMVEVVEKVQPPTTTTMSIPTKLIVLLVVVVFPLLSQIPVVEVEVVVTGLPMVVGVPDQVLAHQGL